MSIAGKSYMEIERELKLMLKDIENMRHNVFHINSLEDRIKRLLK
jgi:hypothetical protein